MSAFLRAELDNAQESLLETFALACAYGDNEAKNSNDYLELMEGICKIKHDSEHHERCLETATAERTISQFEHTLNRQIRACKPVQPKKTSEYKKFKQRLDQISNQVDPANRPSTSVLSHDEDISVHESNVDPFTKKRLVDPMRNTICKHVFEKTTILEAMYINPSLRCPVPGCVNSKPFKAADLIPDVAFKKRLQQISESEGVND